MIVDRCSRLVSRTCSIEWWHCRWPTTNHHNFCILRCLSYIPSRHVCCILQARGIEDSTYRFLLTHSFKLPNVNSPLNSTWSASSFVCRWVGRNMTADLYNAHTHTQQCIVFRSC